LGSRGSASSTLSALRGWRQRYPLFVWRYEENTSNYPGWHLSASPESAASVLELLGLMRTAAGPTQKALLISPPTPAVLAVPNNRRSTWLSPRRLELRCAKGAAVDPALWRLALHGDDLRLSFSAQELERLAAGIGDVGSGKGDYFIGSGKSALWFWWSIAGAPQP